MGIYDTQNRLFSLFLWALGVFLAGCPAEVRENEAPLHLEGAVILEGEEDASGIGVRLSFDDGGIAGQPTSTNRAGEFVFPNVPKRNLRLDFYKEGFVSKNGVPALLEGGAFVLNEGEPVVLEPDRSASLFGTLTSVLPPEFLIWDNLASIRLEGPESVTVSLRPDGTFEKVALRPGLYTLHVKAHGHQEIKGLALSIQPGQSMDLGLLPMVPRAVAFDGVVMEEEGGLEGVSVQANMGQDLASLAQSGSDGKFQMQLVPFPHKMTFTKDGFMEARDVELGWDQEEERFFISQSTDGRSFLMDPMPTAALRGTVSSSVGEFDDWPVRSSVTLEALDGDVERIAPVINVGEGKGAFQFVALPLGRYRVQVFASGHLNNTREVELEEGENSLEEVVLTPEVVDHGVALRGRICRRSCENQEGHAGIRVRVSVGANALGEVTTREDGTFEVNASRTEHSLEISAPGFLPQRFDVVWSGVQGAFLIGGERFEDALVELSPDLSASVVGTLRSDASNTPFGSARVRLDCVSESCAGASSGSFLAARSGEGGTFEANNLIPGRYQLSIDLPGYAPVVDVVDLEAGTVLGDPYVLISDREGDSAVPLAGSILLSEQGEDSPAGALVRVYRADRGTLYATTTTNEDGDFSTLVSPDLDYEVVVSLEGWQAPNPPEAYRWDAEDERFEDTEGESPEIRMVREIFSGAISVTLRVFPEWIPTEQRTANLRLVSSNGPGGETADQASAIRHGESFEFSPLRPGTYFVIAERPGFAQEQRVLVLDRGHPTASISMDIGLQNLDASGVDLSGEEIVDAHLLALGEGALRGADLSGVKILPGSGGGGEPCRASGECSASAFCGPEGVCVARANLCGQDLSGVSFVGADLGGADLTGARLAGANFSNTSLNEARMVGADMQGASFFGANMRRADLAGVGPAFCPHGEPNPRAGEATTLLGADLSSASLVEARFSEGAYSIELVDRDKEPGFDIPNEDFNDDAAGGFDTIDVEECEGATVSSMIVEVDVVGTPKYLRVDLIAPDGTAYRIHNKRDLGGYRLRERYQTPLSSLEAFVGAQAHGEWTLHAFYDLPNAQGLPDPDGKVNYWRLQIECSNPEAETSIPANAEEACSYEEGVERPAIQLGGVNFAQADLSGAYMDGVDFGGGHDDVANLSNSLLRGTHMNRACLRGGSFVLTNLFGAEFSGADLEGSLFQGSVLSEARFRGAKLDRVNFSGANLDGTVFDRASMKRVNLLGVTTYQTSFVESDLSNSLATGVLFSEAVFIDTTIDRTDDFVGVQSFGDWRFVSCVECIFQGNNSLRGLLLNEANFAYTDFGSYTNRDSVVDFGGADLSGANLIGSSFRNGIFTGAVLDNVDLSDAYLNDANMDDVHMEDARLVDASMSRVTLNRARLSRSVFDDAQVDNCELDDARAIEASFVDARLLRCSGAGFRVDQSNFTGANLGSVQWEGADLSICDFSNSNARYANLSRAHLNSIYVRDADWTGVDLSGTSDWNGNQPSTSVRFLSTNLLGANFSGRSIRSGSFAGSNLSGSNFSGALFQRDLEFSQGNTPVHLGLFGSRTKEPQIDMSGVDLSGATLTDACLSSMVFDGANLTNADVSRSVLSNSRFEGATLTGVTWLDAVMTLGAFTYRGNGQNLGRFFAPADLSGAIWEGRDALGERVNENTRWPEDFFGDAIGAVESAFRGGVGQRCCRAQNDFYSRCE